MFEVYKLEYWEYLTINDNLSLALCTKVTGALNLPFFNCSDKICFPKVYIWMFRSDREFGSSLNVLCACYYFRLDDELFFTCGSDAPMCCGKKNTKKKGERLKMKWSFSNWWANFAFCSLYCVFGANYPPPPLPAGGAALRRCVLLSAATVWVVYSPAPLSGSATFAGRRSYRVRRPYTAWCSKPVRLTRTDRLAAFPISIQLGPLFINRLAWSTRPFLNLAPVALFISVLSLSLWALLDWRWLGDCSGYSNELPFPSPQSLSQTLIVIVLTRRPPRRLFFRSFGRDLTPTLRLCRLRFRKRERGLKAGTAVVPNRPLSAPLWMRPRSPSSPPLLKPGRFHILFVIIIAFFKRV